MGPFDWSSDGCSAAGRRKPSNFDLAKIFNPAFQLHDFGYRNFGKSAGRNERTRAWIDGRFHTEMDRSCDDKWGSWWQWANNEACHGEAYVMYKVVRKFNHWSPPKHKPKPKPTPAPTPTPPPRRLRRRRRAATTRIRAARVDRGRPA